MNTVDTLRRHLRHELGEGDVWLRHVRASSEASEFLLLISLLQLGSRGQHLKLLASLRSTERYDACPGLRVHAFLVLARLCHAALTDTNACSLVAHLCLRIHVELGLWALPNGRANCMVGTREHGRVHLLCCRKL